MTILLGLLSTGKGTWSYIGQLISKEDWEKVILLTNDFGFEKFSHEKKPELIKLNFNQPISILRDDIVKELKNKLSGEVAINFISGEGNEHMAFLSALIRLGVGFRIVTLQENQLIEV